MINKIKTLLNKTTELENKISSYEKSSNNKDTSNCLTISKNLLNYSTLSKTKITITSLEVQKGTALYFQNLIELNTASSQKVTFSILIDNILIHKSTRTLDTGFNQISLLKNYTPLESKEIEIELEITPLESKQIILTNNTLFVWGLAKKLSEIQYQAFEKNDYYLITFMENNFINYLFASKVNSTFNNEDFLTFKSALSYSFVEYDNTIFLFRVDLNNNLYVCNFDDKNETFLMSNISYVSASSGDDSILVCIVKNKSCFYFEFKNNSISSTKELLCQNIPIIKCLCFYNNYSKKFYVVMSNSLNENYIAESISTNSSESENISASYSIKITSQEEE